jgi:hypothetical protein
VTDCAVKRIQTNTMLCNAPVAVWFVINPRNTTSKFKNVTAACWMVLNRDKILKFHKIKHSLDHQIIKCFVDRSWLEETSLKIRLPKRV